MPSDPLAAQARREHRASLDAGRLADRHREIRNRLVRQLRASDERVWTYEEIARQVGITAELARAIVKGRV